MEDYVLYRPEVTRFQDLHLNFCGYEACDPLHSFGPAVRPNYIIHCVLEGRGLYRSGEKTWQLGPGDGFLIRPGELTFYQADASDPWTYLWIGFEGKLAPVIMRNLGLGDAGLAFHCGETEELKKIVLTMLKHSTCSEANTLLLESQLYLFLSVLMREAQPDPSQEDEKGNIYVSAAEEYIRNHYAEEVRVTDIAAYTGIHRSYLFTLFRRQAGMSPQQYLARYRLSRAAELLSSTEYSVESIAMSCGYRDPQVFTKAFKGVYSVTPSSYRRDRETDRREKLREGRRRLEELQEDSGHGEHST